MFKTTDERFEELGFVMTEDLPSSAIYERYNARFDYTHVIAIMMKRSGNHIIQSYEKRCNTDYFNNVVGMSEAEAKLAIKKLKELKKHYNKGIRK